MKLGCGHPMGPLTLCDFIGLDVLYAIGDSLYEEFKRPEYAPPPLLKRMVVSGPTAARAAAGSTTTTTSAPSQLFVNWTRMPQLILARSSSGPVARTPLQVKVALALLSILVR